jgi:hypothetical protein
MVFLILFLTMACAGYDLVPAEAEDQLTQALNELWDDLLNTATGWVGDQIDKLIQSITDDFTESITDSFNKVKEYLGLAVPEDVGKLSIAINLKTDPAVVNAAFDQAYRDAGAGRVIGWPQDLVYHWSDGHAELLVQFFVGGSEKRSAIVMEQGKTTAYTIPGEWLVMYENLGGPGLAGYPTSSPETWNINPVFELWTNWGRGDRQLFTLGGYQYALLQPSGMESVYLVPPGLWEVYQEASEEIGYPLSSYPIDESRWRDQPGISEDTRAILNLWEQQPFRMQVFEHGSLIWLDAGGDVEIVEYGKVASVFNLGEANLLLGVRRELGEVYTNLYVTGKGDTCFANTMRHAANMAADASGDILIPQVALIPIRAVLTGTSLTIETALGKFALAASEVLVEVAGGEDLEDAVQIVIVGKVIDSIYTKAVGDIISTPLKETSMIILEEEGDRLSRDRIYNESTIQIGDGNIKFTADMNAKLSIQYDPITRTLTGVVVSDCAPQGIAFFYRAEPDTGYMADATQVWDGRVHFIDLAGGQKIIP